MRTLLLTGPGGAGTSTLAAAAAVRSARAGRRTLLLSRQPAAGAGAGRRRRARASSASTRRRRSSGCGASAAGAVGAVVPHLTLPPESSVVPMPGTGRPRALRRARARRGRPRRPGRRTARVDGRAGRAALGAALVARPAACRRACGRSVPCAPPPSPTGAARRGPIDAALAAVPVVEELLARDRLDRAHDASAWSPSPRRAAVPALRAAVTTLALHGLTTGARAHPGAAARRRGGVGSPSVRRAGRRPDRGWPRSRPVHRVPEHARPPGRRRRPRRACSTASLPAGRRGTPQPPAAERHDGAWQLTVPLPFAERGRPPADPVGRRPRRHRRGAPAGRSGSIRCCGAAR